MKENKIKRFTYEDMQRVFEQVIMPLFALAMFLSFGYFLIDKYILGIVSMSLSILLVYILNKRIGFM